MKFVCLAYFDDPLWKDAPESKRLRFERQCLEFEDELNSRGLLVSREAIEWQEKTLTLLSQNSRSVLAECPRRGPAFILKIEAGDLNHAVAILSLHPRLQIGSFEIFPADERLNFHIAAHEISNTLELKKRIHALSVSHNGKK